MNAARRLDRLRERLGRDGLDALAVTDPVNVTYITGFDAVFDFEPAHVALVDAQRALLITDGRYEQSAREAASQTSWEVQVAESHAVATLVRAAGELGRLGIEDSMPLARFKQLEAAFPGALVATSGLLLDMRQVKEPEEIARIEAAQAITDAAFAHIVEFIAVGRTEREIALELEFYMRTHGSEGVAFASIVASGPNSAKPHAQVTDRRLHAGDLLKLDFGARVEGYCSDMTRTVCLGPAADWQREVYGAVAEANAAGIAAVVAGRPASDVDATARAVLQAAGFEERFTHGLGHGLGLEVHERPGVSKRNNDPLPEGAVITIEPGVYLPEQGGVRIEDLVVVEQAGCRVLTRSPKELLEL